ncbi:unnamed protein product [Ambrosiozyma monospora]|uniref:Unnamed protein product n=1 Tax=Ambrosiozyma monospora TaxID=43982 RepID=A0ACB5SZ51_AMBMO|nr:unnamed protein product [Ambrosiozyma monospora]
MSEPHYTPEEIEHYKQLDLAKSTIELTIKSSQSQDSTKLQKPKVLIVCGSGLGGISEILQGETIKIPYGSIPGFKTSTVPGHDGSLLFGLIGENKVPVMCMVGRLHFYEGYDFKEATFPIRVASLLGVEYLLVTNAAGGINSTYKPGDLMIINDHLNLPGLGGFHCLRGGNLSKFGPRFQPLSDAYDFNLRLKFLQIARDTLKLTRAIHEGVYCYASGPTFESRAEVRMIRAIGGDAVGMSTVPEVIVARHSGLKVFGLSLITNAGLGEPPVSALEAYEKGLTTESVVDQAAGMASHSEVLESADAASKDVKKLFEAFVNELK